MSGVAARARGRTYLYYHGSRPHQNSYTPAVWPGGPMRSARTIGLTSLFAFALLLTAATNEARASGSERLRREVLPTFERVKLNLDARKPDYTGSASIDLKVVTAVDSFQFHSEGLTLRRVT